MSASSLQPHQRAQYLEAMGLTLWVPRYSLPNALESEGCEWPEAVVAEHKGHSERLQDMLKEADQPRQSAPAQASHDTAHVEGAARPDIRALLKGSPAEDQPTPASDQDLAAPTQSTPGEASTDPAPASVGPDNSESTTVEASPSAPASKHPLRFSFDSMVLGNQWLVLSVGEYFDDQATRLVDAMLSAIGEAERTPSLHVDFSWPIVEGFLTDDPRAEAGEGVRAFVEGRQFAGAELKGVLVFAAADDDRSAPLIDVLGMAGQQSELLEMPVVLAPSLSELYSSGRAKREVWKRLRHLNSGGE